MPRALKRPILATTWVSSKWQGRAPADRVLIRAFFGGAWGEEVLANDDAQLAAIAESEISAFLGVGGAPLFTRVFRFNQANPQPLVGHLTRVAKVRTMLGRWPGIHVAGSGFDGVGIPDCVRQAGEVAGAILSTS